MKALSSSLLLSLLLLSACGSTPISKEDFQSLNAKGLAVTEPTADSWYHHTCDDKMYMENWMILTQFDTGEIMYLQFLYSNVGVFAGSSGMSVSLTDAEGKVHFFNGEYSQSEFVEDKQKGTITIGGTNVMTIGADTITVKADFEGFEADLVVTPTAKGVQFGDGGTTYFDKEKSKYFKMYYHVPAATVTGTVTVGDEVKIASTGKGYLDHNLSNITSSEYSDTWYSLRLFAGDYTVDIVEFFTTEEYGALRVGRVIVAGPDGVLLATDTFDLAPSDYVKDKDPVGYKYPTKYTLGAKGEGVSLVGSYAVKSMHDKSVILDRLPWAQKKIAQMFAGNPIIYRFVVTTDLTLTIGDEAIPIDDEGLVEYIVVHDVPKSTAPADTPKSDPPADAPKSDPPATTAD